MPAKLVKSGSNVADLITSAGLFGNALAKDQEIQSSDQTAAPKHTRRLVTSRANSVDPPALIATGLLSRSASAKLQSPVSSWPSWSASLSKQSPHDIPSSVRPSKESAQEAPSLVGATSALTSTNSSSGFQISAAKPSLLAQIQAVSQQPASSPTAKQQSSSHSQSHSDSSASGADAAQATVSDEVVGVAIAAKHASSAAVAAAFPQAHDERGASSVSPKLNTTRQQSSDSIFGDGDAEGQEAEQADLPAGKAQRPGSAVARQGSRLTDDTLQATVREAQAMAANADISRRKAERRAQKLDKEVSHLQTQLTNHQRQTDVLLQQVADASAASDQQKQSHQRMLALLDQAHLAQLSELQKQLHQQSTCHSEAATTLKARLVEQADLSQQLQRAMTDLELEHQSLKRKSAEEQAVTKMLLKQQADSAAQTPPTQDTAAECTVTEIHKENTRSDPQPAAKNPFLSVAAPASQTLALEADVLRREARVLRDGLAKVEAAVQKLTQARREDELQSSLRLSQLEWILNELEKKHQGSAAVLDQTIAAMQTRTSILLQQRQSGQDEAAAAQPGPTSNSPQLKVLSDMNEHLASENAALIAELTKLQRKQKQQGEEVWRQKQGPSLVAGVPAHQLESLLSLPGTSPAAAVAVPCSSSASSVPLNISEAHAEAPGANEAEKTSLARRETAPDWDASHATLQQRAQTLEAQMELTRLAAEGEILRAEADKAATAAQTKQGVIYMLQRQLSAAHSQHDKEVKDLKRAAKLMERRTEELAQQLPKANGDSALQVQAIRDDHAKQRHAWASARRTLQAQQSSLQDECNDLACQLAERDQQLRARDERISYLKKLLEEANLAVTSRCNSEAVALDVELGSGPLVSSASASKDSSGPAHPERAPSDVEPNLDLPARLTLQRYRNEVSGAKYEMTAVMKELKRHKKESERVQLQQQLSIRGLKEQVNLAQQALQQQVEVNEEQQSVHQRELDAVTAETSSLQSQLQAADTQIYVTDTHLQASRLNMRYLKVRQQLSQAAPVLSYVQAYEVSCGPQEQGSSEATL